MTLKVGGFAEFLPNQQRVVDFVQSTVVETAKLWGYDSITTTSVERNEVLFKGGDATTKEIYGLYGLATGPSDTKGYGLHFDLTVPFTRYVADNAGSLTFPFKRVQSQSCRRGERPQKGRYREFTQADVDVIWHQADKSWALYEAEVVALLADSLQKILTTLKPDTVFKVHYNNRNLLQGLFQSVSNNSETHAALAKLFDNYYKLPKEKFVSQLTELLPDHADTILERTALSVEQLSTYTRDNILYLQGVAEVNAFIEQLTRTGSGGHCVFDPFIVRGLDYYTGMVFETFIGGAMQRGSFCSGGRYDNLVQEVDPKAQAFDGVGGSIGVSRLCAYLFDHGVESLPGTQRTLIANMNGSEAEAQRIATHVRSQGAVISLYPIPDKLGKQYTYAEKSGFTDVIVCGPKEREAGVYLAKNLATGKQTEHSLSNLA